MIEFNQVQFGFGAFELALDFHISQGQRVVLLGPSGAGKSTLLDLVAGFNRPREGVIRLDGQLANPLPPNARPVTTLFQEHNLFSHLTVFQNIGLGLDPALRLSDPQRRALAEAAEQVGLHGMLDRLPGELSGGQRQRVALARCLLRQQPILLLDEPFSALDPALRSDMLQLVLRLVSQNRLTLLMVSHNPEDALVLADRIWIIEQGQLVDDLTPAQFGQRL